MPPSNPPSNPSASGFESWSSDLVKGVGLQDINVNVDAEATVAANSTANSAAVSANVTGDSGSLSDVDFNSGLQATTTNTFDVASNAGLSGIATTTANASAATSAGDATGFATIGDSAGLSDISSLEVGGELTALGKSVNTITGSAETVVGQAAATGSLSSAIQGFDAAGIDVSSNASIQGLAQLTNSASASAVSGTPQVGTAQVGTAQVGTAQVGTAAVGTYGRSGYVAASSNYQAASSNYQAASSNYQAASADYAPAEASFADATAFANDLTGASLEGLDVGGVASLAGQASLGNTSNATNVVGAAIASSELVTATGLEATALAGPSNFGIDVSSDATITGLSSITSSATAATTAGLADANSIGGNIQGIDIADAQIGGVGSITGQSNFTGNAKSSNVTGGNSTADSDLTAAGGFAASDLIDISSDATFKGLSSINMSAMAESTGASAAPTLADAAFDGGDVTGASLDEVTIGGIGNVLGQVGFTGAATANNVTGNAEATGDLASAMGLKTIDNMTVSSDGTLKGIASVTGSAIAETTAGVANAAALAGNINGADFNDLVDIGGLGSIQGAASFNLSAKSTNVTGGADGSDATAGDNTLQAIGLQAVVGGTTPASSNYAPASSNYAPASSNYAPASSNYAPASSNYTPASSNYVPAVGSQFLSDGSTPNPNYVPQVGTAQVGTAQVGTAQVGTAQVGTPPVLFDNLSDSIYGIDIASDATLSGTAIGTLKAEAFSTATDADAMVGNGADLIGAQIGDLNVGGIASVTGAAQLTGNGTAQNVGGTNFDASASTGLDATVTGLDAKLMDVASDATITAQAFGTLNATATSTGGAATAHAGGDGADANSGVTTLTGLASGLDLNIGGVGTLSALAQGSENASATSVDGIATATAGMDLLGGHGLDFASSSNGSLTGIAKLVTTVDATSTAATAQVNGDFSAIGFTGLEIGTISGVNGATGDLAGIGGVSTIKGQAQIAGTLNAESVSGDAFAGVNDPHSIITGLNNVVLNGASDGTVLGTASGVFNTNATNIGGTGFDASAASYQDLKGISSLDLNLGGNGGINAIVNDTNFVGAHSVSGNATAVATVDAIGLAGGDIHIAGNASILSTVGVDSKAESHTMG